MDDIVTGAKSFNKYLEDLEKLFLILIEWNVSLTPEKTYLNYPDLKLLGRLINSLRLITAEDKLKAIAKLCYPSILGELEHYLKLTNYIRPAVHWYTQLAELLQQLKTDLLKLGPNKGNTRKRYLSIYKFERPINK